MENLLVKEVAAKVNVSIISAQKTLELFLQENCTVPFIARYRKEVTQNLDETQIRNVIEGYEEFIEREKRRSFVLETLEKQGNLTPEIKQSILRATSEVEIEEIYKPFKTKKKSKATIAREFGLGPFAEKLQNESILFSDLLNTFKFDENIKTPADFKDGVESIIIEKIVYEPKVKENLKSEFLKIALMESELKKDGDKVEDAQKFQDYFSYKEPLKDLYQSSASHRFLAMRRGLLTKVLKLTIQFPEDVAGKLINDSFLWSNKLENQFLQNAIIKAYKIYLYPSLEMELFTEMKNIAEEAAIKVFGVNLKNLLLAPYLGSKVVMGVDPGIRTGCKIVVIGDNSKLLFDHVIYLNGDHQIIKTKNEIEKIIEMFHVEYVCIGNGTFGRETLAFFENEVKQIKDGKTQVTMISEAGASVYSASKEAIEEFPEKDVTVRGAISIARRFQDPLSELVKIDPKAIGVGQYQHDVNAIKLKKSLTSVVEDCVNYVGVDLNTCSYYILSFISGIGPAMAKSIVEYRQKYGLFKKRDELLKIGRFTEKVFQQSAGFLRIYGGENPLDATFVHPEQYAQLEDYCQLHKISLQELLSSTDQMNKLQNNHELKNKMGELTFKDMIKSILAPSQDPRTAFKSTEFDKELKSINDVKIGTWYKGVVTNITNFGAFVDIGIKENGLVHISHMADHFVKDPLTVIKIGQEVQCRVLEVDKSRSRLALSLKKEDANNEGRSRMNMDAKSQMTGQSNYQSGNSRVKSNHFEQHHQTSHHKPSPPVKSAFSALKDFKLNK